jgi:hypothetical protein
MSCWQRGLVVIVDWGSGELLPNTTHTYREMFNRRSAAHWKTANVTGDSPEIAGLRVPREHGDATNLLVGQGQRR